MSKVELGDGTECEITTVICDDGHACVAKCDMTLADAEYLRDHPDADVWYIKPFVYRPIAFVWDGDPRCPSRFYEGSGGYRQTFANDFKSGIARACGGQVLRASKVKVEEATREKATE